SNVRERGGRNSERIRAALSLASPSLALPLAGRGTSGGTRESGRQFRGDRPNRSGAPGVDYAIRPSFSRALRPLGWIHSNYRLNRFKFALVSVVYIGAQTTAGRSLLEAIDGALTTRGYPCREAF